MQEITIEPMCEEAEIVVSDTNIPIVVGEIAHDANIETMTEYIVEAHINEWTLINDYIYVSQEYGELPPWLRTAIEEVLEDPDGLLVDSIEELTKLFDQFEEGYEARVITLENSDESQNTYISSLVSKTDNNAAGIIRIDSTYATKDYAYATSTEVVGAYLNDGALGGAWFERSVSAVADVAYSAARSASSLNASIKSNTAELSRVWGSLEDLSKQVDGQIVTWFVPKTDPNPVGMDPADPAYVYFDPIGPVITAPGADQGKVNPDGRPYWCWTAGNICSGEIYTDDDTLDTRAHHTGDVYVWYELDPHGAKQIISTWRFYLDTDTGLFTWGIFTDDLASQAYQAALEAQDAADGKVSTYYQSWAPTLADAGLVAGEAWKMNGDIWYDSTLTGTTPIGTMRRYNGLLPGGAENPNWHEDNWEEVSDNRIEASVVRLESATVDIDGSAVAKASLKVEAIGGSGETAVVGYQASAESDNHGAQSKFRIYADKFEIANNQTSLPVFEIDSSVSPAIINFTGSVRFNYDSIDDPPEIPEEQDLTPYVTKSAIKSPGQTIINGANISTGYMSAVHISAGSIWTDGLVRSGDFSWDYSYSSTVTGFSLDAREGAYWDIIGGNIYGSYIRGAKIYATTLDAVEIKTGTLYVDNLIATGSLTGLQRPTGSDRSIYVSNSKGAGTQLNFTMNATLDYGRMLLYRDGTLLAIVCPSHDGVYYTWSLTYTDNPYNATYKITNAVGVTLGGVGAFAAVSYKK